MVTVWVGWWMRASGCVYARVLRVRVCLCVGGWGGPRGGGLAHRTITYWVVWGGLEARAMFIKIWPFSASASTSSGSSRSRAFNESRFSRPSRPTNKPLCVSAGWCAPKGSSPASPLRWPRPAAPLLGASSCRREPTLVVDAAECVDSRSSMPAARTRRVACRTARAAGRTSCVRAAVWKPAAPAYGNVRGAR
jgi:hypothetical protein